MSDEARQDEPMWILDPQPNVTVREMAEILRGLRVMAKGEKTLERFHRSVHRHFKRINGDQNETSAQ